MPTLKLFLLSIPVVLAMDALWLGVLAKNLYRQSIGPLMRMQGGELAPIWLSAAMVYVLIPLGIALFVLPRAAGNVWHALFYGAIFGVVLYGVYDFTNHSLLKGWPFSVVLIDVLWGAVLCGVTAMVVEFLAMKFGW